MACSRQAPVQLIRGANQGEVGKRLGKVPQVFAAWPQLLGVEAQMVRIAEGLLEIETALLEISAAGKTPILTRITLETSCTALATTLHFGRRRRERR